MIFHTECIGIKLAAESIIAGEVKTYSIRILSDNMSVFQALDSANMDSQLTYESHSSLIICTHNKITLQWLKGYNSCNYAGDEIAGRGSEMDATKVSCPYQWLKSTTHKSTKT